MRIRGLTGVVMAVAVASSCADAAPPGGEAQVAGTLEVGATEGPPMC